MGLGIPALIATQVVGGLIQSSQQRRAGRQGLAAAKENAASFLSTTKKNVGLGLEAAEWNAAAIEAVGEYNAEAILSAAAMNAELMGVQAVEEMRQHMLQERQVGGTIRAMAASSGLSVNEGTPAHFYNFQVEEMVHSRKYLAYVSTTSILNYIEQESTRADLVLFESQLKADSTRYNARIEAEIALNDAQMQADAMIRSGQAMNQSARISSVGTLLNTAIGIGQTYAAYGTPSLPASTPGWQASMAIGPSPYSTTPGGSLASPINPTVGVGLTYSGQWGYR